MPHLNISSPQVVGTMGRDDVRAGLRPVRDYLDSLEWDGVDRLDTWLTLLGAEDTELNRAYGRKTLIGAVRRARQPGAKHDTILVLQGPQGSGKSSAIRALCPNEEYFSGSLGIGDTPKEVIEATMGKWLVELADLAGMDGRTAFAIKDMLFRTVDRARSAYGRQITELAAPVHSVRHGKRGAMPLRSGWQPAVLAGHDQRPDRSR